MTWYVIADREDAEPNDRIWTLSRDPNIPGWNTDSGYQGYGLTKADAEELANAANRRELTLIDKLRVVGGLKSGDTFPDWLVSNGDWGKGLSKLCNEAADELARLNLANHLGVK